MRILYFSDIFGSIAIGLHRFLADELLLLIAGLLIVKGLFFMLLNLVSGYGFGTLNILDILVGLYIFAIINGFIFFIISVTLSVYLLYKHIVSLQMLVD